MIFFKKLNEKLSSIDNNFRAIDTRLSWIENQLTEIQKNQERGEKRQKYIIEKQVELHILFKKYLKWIKEDWDKKQ